MKLPGDSACSLCVQLLVQVQEVADEFHVGLRAEGLSPLKDGGVLMSRLMDSCHGHRQAEQQVFFLLWITEKHRLTQTGEDSLLKVLHIRAEWRRSPLWSLDFRL